MADLRDSMNVEINDQSGKLAVSGLSLHLSSRIEGTQLILKVGIIDLVGNPSRLYEDTVFHVSRTSGDVQITLQTIPFTSIDHYVVVPNGDFELVFQYSDVGIFGGSLTIDVTTVLGMELGTSTITINFEASVTRAWHGVSGFSTQLFETLIEQLNSVNILKESQMISYTPNLNYDYFIYRYEYGKLSAIIDTVTGFNSLPFFRIFKYTYEENTYLIYVSIDPTSAPLNARFDFGMDTELSGIPEYVESSGK